jgi:hypothetical protein
VIKRIAAAVLASILGADALTMRDEAGMGQVTALAGGFARASPGARHGGRRSSA